ncbi:DNA translocase FtsK [Actibacterium sp. 188UL27-1]|uniref:DNA translocase FtsK n=1 Tax=Actibacterium sp. 188UL27-1 TaxID=2786961 RepID=UPI00195A3DFD|nr:DNA translocase FtsK [Actibacterium sp. 188UL27-1]MBM7065971.1 DNA translocase FtsK [Actibacterium sp. 188UL27-1]
MAYQTKQRDPLFDSTMQAALERRSKELIGIGLVAVALLLAALLFSFVPEDTNWISATDQAAQNWLGRGGATVALVLFFVLGFAAWILPLVIAAWGIRFILKTGHERVLGRSLLAILVVAIASAYAASLGAPTALTGEFGRGGALGDTVLGLLVILSPIQASLVVKILGFVLGLATLALTPFAMGFTWAETKRLLAFLLIGLIRVYGSLMTTAGRGAQTTAAMARTMRDRQATRKALLPDPKNADFVAEPLTINSPPILRAEKPVKQGLLGQMTAIVKRPAEPVEIEDELVIEDLAANLPDDAPPEDRIKARIADAIRLRARQGRAATTRAEPPVLRSEPPLRARKPEPLLIKTPGAIPPAPMAELDPVIEEPPAPASYTMPTADPVEQPRAVVQHPARKAPAPSRQAAAEAQPSLALGTTPEADWEFPPLSLLGSPEAIQRHQLSDESLEENARMLENVLDDYGVKGEIVSVRPGPVVTMYELEPAPGLKASRVIGLADDIARSMSALSARVSTLPGRSVIGIELPNATREKVVLREILSARDFGDANMRLPLALGKDIGGGSMVANLAKMPHLLIAGTTGSGKSVAINTMILSLLYRLSPEECRLIMIDPKMLELSVYDGIPHLLSPVVTDPKKAVVALKWVVGEMEDRYRKMSKMGVRNIEGYNGRVKDALAKGEMFSRTVQTGFDDETGEPVFETDEFAPEALPFIVVIVDEMADLMMVAGKEIEACIQRLAQMARASGIHLIMATQRPSVDVITGTIKANFPTRISFQVTSKIDSRTILGEMGAEQLLGMGDMLYMAGGGKITRCHGPFVSDEEVEEVVKHLKMQGPPEYIGGVVDGPDEDKESSIDQVLGLGGNTDGEDALYDQAVQVVLNDRKCSTSYIQRKLAIGYNKAARLVEQMEDNGLVSASNHVGKREILVPEQQ